MSRRRASREILLLHHSVAFGGRKGIDALRCCGFFPFFPLFGFFFFWWGVNFSLPLFRGVLGGAPPVFVPPAQAGGGGAGAALGWGVVFFFSFPPFPKGKKGGGVVALAHFPCTRASHTAESWSATSAVSEAMDFFEA